MVEWRFREGEIKTQEAGIGTEGLCLKAGLGVQEDHCFMWDWEKNMDEDIDEFTGEEVESFERSYLMASISSEVGSKVIC